MMDVLRFRLFALRDRLRKLKDEQPEEVSNQVFNLTQDTINSAILLMPHISITELRRFRRRFEADPRLRQLALLKPSA